MEENIDPLKENRSNQEKSLTNESVDNNIKRDQSNLINKVQHNILDNFSLHKLFFIKI